MLWRTIGRTIVKCVKQTLVFLVVTNIMSGSKKEELKIPFFPWELPIKIQIRMISGNLRRVSFQYSQAWPSFKNNGKILFCLHCPICISYHEPLKLFVLLSCSSVWRTIGRTIVKCVKQTLVFLVVTNIMSGSKKEELKIPFFPWELPIKIQIRMISGNLRRVSFQYSQAWPSFKNNGKILFCLHCPICISYHEPLKLFVDKKQYSFMKSDPLACWCWQKTILFHEKWPPCMLKYGTANVSVFEFLDNCIPVQKWYAEDVKVSAYSNAYVVGAPDNLNKTFQLVEKTMFCFHLSIYQAAKYSQRTSFQNEQQFFFLDIFELFDGCTVLDNVVGSDKTENKLYWVHWKSRNSCWKKWPFMPVFPFKQFNNLSFIISAWVDFLILHNTYYWGHINKMRNQ